MCHLFKQKKRKRERERSLGELGRGAGEMHINVIVYIM